MSIKLGDNISITAGLPADCRYYNGNVPYVDEAEVNSVISEGVRYSGLTVNVAGVEYWYKDGVTDNDLIEKTTSGGGLLNWSGTTANAIGTYISASGICAQPNLLFNGSNLTFCTTNGSYLVRSGGTDMGILGVSSGNGGYFTAYDKGGNQGALIRSYAVSGEQAFFNAGKVRIGSYNWTGRDGGLQFGDDGLANGLHWFNNTGSSAAIFRGTDNCLWLTRGGAECIGVNIDNNNYLNVYNCISGYGTTLRPNILGFTRNSANYIWADTADGYLLFGSSGRTKSLGNGSLYVAANGNVGIGGMTCQPTSTLEVNGDSEICGTVISDDICTTTLNNVTATIDNVKVDGYGLIGNRGSLYLTNACSTGDFKFGYGLVHGNTSIHCLSSTLASFASNLHTCNIKIPRTSCIVFQETYGSNDRAMIFSSQNEFTGDYNGIGFSIGSNGKSSPSMYIAGNTNAGDVGIGTTTPLSQLHINMSNANLSTTNSGIQISQGGAGAAAISYVNTGNYAWMGGMNASTNKFHISRSGQFSTAPDLTITTDGDFGIGCCIPAYKLHVNGTGYFKGNTTICGSLCLGEGTTTVSGDTLLYFNSDRPWLFCQDGNDASAHLVLQATSDGKTFYIRDINGNPMAGFSSSATGSISSAQLHYGDGSERLRTTSYGVCITNTLCAPTAVNTGTVVATTVCGNTYGGTICAGTCLCSSGSLHVLDSSVFGSYGCAQSTVVDILAPDSYIARLSVHGSSQGTGILWVGQDSSSYGGGIVYHGDATPACNFPLDRIAYIRSSAGLCSTVFSYAHNSDQVCFEGDTTATIHCGRTCVSSPITCGTTRVQSPIICGTSCVRSDILCAVGSIDGAYGSFTISTSTAVACATTCVETPYIYATSVCGTACISTAGSIRAFDTICSENLIEGLSFYSNNNIDANTTIYAGACICSTVVCSTAAGGFRNSGTGYRMCLPSGCGCAVDWVATSDKRLKRDIVPISSALSTVTSLCGVCYEFCEDGTKDIGLIAQEVFEVEPRLVTKGEPSEKFKELYNINDEVYGLKYDKFAGLFVEAIKELKCQNEMLCSEITELKKIINK